MYHQVNFEKRRVLVQDVIDRLTRLNANQIDKYLQGLEALHSKFNVDSETDALGVRYYSTNKHLAK
jgi:hypothetical protein